MRDVEYGVVDTGEDLVSVMTLSAVHFALLGPEEQAQVTRGLVSLAAGLEFPVKVWATNRPLSVRAEVERMDEMAANWAQDERHAVIAEVCAGIGDLLANWAESEVPERHLYASTWVRHVGRRRENAMADLDRRVEQLGRYLAATVTGCAPQVLGTAEVLQALYGFWQKGRHVRTRAETLGEQGETVIAVSGEGMAP